MELMDAIEATDAVVAAHLSADELGAASSLRLVQVLGAGYDGIAVEALPSGAALCNVFEHEVAISEWALLAMLALTRRLLVYDRDLRRGEWHSGYRFDGVFDVDLRGRTVGLVGLGHIGDAVARLAGAIGMRTIAVTRRPEPARSVSAGVSWLGPLQALTDLLDEADFAVVSVPATVETIDLIGEAQLARLGPGGYLLNVGRGPVVNEKALYNALRQSTIAGAAIDVWYQYPSSNSPRPFPARYPFWELDNVIMTPHVSGFTESTRSQRWAFIAEQIRRLDSGQALHNVVTIGNVDRR